MRVFELEDVILLLRSEVKRGGGQAAWSKKTGIDRTMLSRVLNGHRPLTKTIFRALKLRMVFVSYSKLPQSK